MSVLESKLTSNLFGSQVQRKEPQAKYGEDPCNPAPSPNLNSELKVLYPDTSNNAIPVMGGSIVKISLSEFKKSEKYLNYVKRLDNEIKDLIESDLDKLSKKNTSTIRRAFNVFLINSISSSSIFDISPILYLSCTIANPEDIEHNKEYLEAILKKCKFSFVPIESIKTFLQYISTKTEGTEIVSSDMGSWSGISGSKFFDLYKILTKDESDISGSEISQIIMEIIPYFNIPEGDFLNENIEPSLCGYFTLVDGNIYLKMPDFSGFDSAGYGSNYFESSGFNFLFQVLVSGKEKNTYSIKNIFFEKQLPIYGNITDSIAEFDLKSPGEFSFKISSDAKPKAIYLSPVIPTNVSIKNSGIISGISASQSGSFIEFNNFPNPFVSIFENSIQVTNTVNNLVTCKNIDQPFLQTTYIDLKKIKDKFEIKYNNKEGNKGIFWPYIERIYSDINIAVPKDYFGIGFPFEQDFFEKKSEILGQSLTTYEYVGNISRQNIILHRGVAADTVIEEYSGIKNNNKKYFKKEFISNSTGLCENHRPRVFTDPTSFIPSTWIKSSSISDVDGEYKISFNVSDIKKFYSENASELKFVAYAYDGNHQISKIQNGYLEITKDSPEILSIKPSGLLSDGKIIICDPNRVDDVDKTNILTITTPAAKSVTSIIVNDNITVSKDSDWIVGGTTISFKLPCNELLTTGTTTIKLLSSTVTSSEVKIYVANGYAVQDETTDVSQLPVTINDSDKLTQDDVIPENLFIKNATDSIPISYSDFRSKIKIKSKKKIFKENREIYAYIGFESQDLAKKFSNSIIEVNYFNNKKIFVAKNFSYKISEAIDSDFRRENNKNASLHFPGTSHSQKPLSILTSEVKKAYIILSSDGESDFYGSGNIGIFELGTDTKPAFVPPPIVIGMAATYSDGQKINHFTNFSKGSIIKNISEKILKLEISEISGIESVIVKYKIEKLLVLFKYRDIAKFKKRDFSLYIKDEKVNNIFSLYGIKRASDLDGLDASEEELAKELYYFVAKDINITTDQDAPVRVDLYDRDFYVDNSSKNKYVDLSIRVPAKYISNENNNSESKSIYVISDAIFISKEKDSLGNSFPNGEDLFGSYSSILAQTGIFASGITNNFINLSGYPFANIQSSTSCMISTERYPLPSEKDNFILLSKDTQSDSLENLPYSYFRISAGSEIYAGEYVESSGESEYIIFSRVQINDICKLSALKPIILKASPTELIAPGDRLVLTVKNILPYFKVEIFGKRAKIEKVEKTTILGESEVTVVAPEEITLFTKDDCGIILYNGNQILNKGELELGNKLSEELTLIASGLLSGVTNQFEGYKETLAAKPLKFIDSVLDSANVTKGLLTNFCNLSFHITAELNVYLQGFKQLLVPIKVIFCIIDVICNLFNPFQLPQAVIRLFDCLYDLVLMLPQISIPVMFLSLLIHILDLLECLILKILNFIIIINLTIDAIITIRNADKVSFRDLLVLEELLTKYIISLEADLDVMSPIVQILSIFTQLLGLTFRFPCSTNPNSEDAPCGITGFDVGSMISGLIAEPFGAAPNTKYKFKKEYLLPICQPFTKKSPESISPPSYDYAIEPNRTPAEIVFSSSTFINGNYFENNYFNSKTLRKKESSFDPDLNSIDDINTDTYVSLAAAYTKRKKSISSTQSTIFKFSERTWKSTFSMFDKQLIDETKNFDTPVSLLNKDGNDLSTPIPGATGNFYSLLDGKELATVIFEDTGTYYGTVNPLKISINQGGVEIERTFDSIPAMVILDEELNVYYIEENGIIFEQYNQIDGTSVFGIKEIRATIISEKSSTPESFSKEEEVTGEDDDGNPISQDIFSLPQLYFVDTRVAVELIQAKCETASINQLPLDLGADSGEIAEKIEKVATCIQDFLSSVKNQTSSIKNNLSIGNVPDKFSQEQVEASYLNLINCVKDGIDDVCSLVINPLNTSFKLKEDDNFTEILPSTGLSEEILSNFESEGPPLTGAREYAAGIGDEVNIGVGSSTTIVLIPRDSYDNIINYDISENINIEIISNTTQTAEFVLYPTESNNQNYLIYNPNDGSYTAKIKSNDVGTVKIKASICKKYIEALTYSDVSSSYNEDTSEIDCIPDSISIQPDGNAIPLGVLSRINRVLTINFVKQTVIIGNGSDTPGTDSSENIISNPQEYGTGLEN